MIGLGETFDASQLSASKPTASRKTPGVKYVYVKYADEALSFETPKLTCLRGPVEADNKWGFELDWAGGLPGDEVGDADTKKLHENITTLYEALNKATENIAQTFEPLKFDSASAWSMRAYKTGPKKTLFFDSKSREPMTAEQTKFQEDALRNSVVRLVVTLEGITMNTTDNTIRTVWTADQMLLYPEAPANPFHGQYCFLDDEEYLSLED